MDVSSYIDDHSRESNGVGYLYKHESFFTPLYIIFSGAIDRFICVSWLYQNPRYNCLWVRDVLPYASYTDPNVEKIVSSFAQKYKKVVTFGMSMGGVGALLHAASLPNAVAAIAVDCEPRGISDDELLERLALMNKHVQKHRVHLISCSNKTEMCLHKKIAALYESSTVETCPNQHHLSNVPSCRYLYRLFNLYGSLDYDCFYIDAWERAATKGYKWE